MALTILCTLTAGQAAAQGSFFDRGRELLKEYGTSSGSAGVLGNDEIARGLREALRVGADRVVAALGAADGFNKSTDVHIPLPDTLRTVQRTLSKFGMSGLADELELRLNRAAEAAVPKARTLFGNAIQQMTLDDVQRIYKGPKDAATQYFRGKMASPLVADMRPIVDRQLSEVGAVQAYDRMIGQYRSIPFVPDVKADLTEYVLGRAVDAVFLYLGREEAAIRENPAKRTTELLQKVFGSR